MSSNKFLESYSKFLQKFLKPQKPLKVVFDCSNGMAGLVLKQLKTGKIKTYFINEKSDGNFPAHGPNPLNPGAANQLQAAVKKHQADLGIIFDADGDRAFFVDNKGRLIDPDIIARLLVWQLKPKKIVVDVATGWLVKRLKIQNSGFKIIESKVGHYFIKKMMRSENADFGAEQSGHYYFKKFFGLDSGIMAGIEVINAVSGLPYRLSDFIEFLPRYYHQEINIFIKKAEPVNLLKAVERTYQKEVKKVFRLDGLTMEFSDWWFNLRFSQTEPLARLNIETKEKSKLQKESNQIKKFFK